MHRGVAVGSPAGTTCSSEVTFDDDVMCTKHSVRLRPTPTK
jgi:hypothetical protein